MHWEMTMEPKRLCLLWAIVVACRDVTQKEIGSGTTRRWTAHDGKAQAGGRDSPAVCASDCAKLIQYSFYISTKRQRYGESGQRQTTHQTSFHNDADGCALLSSTYILHSIEGLNQRVYAGQVQVHHVKYLYCWRRRGCGGFIQMRQNHGHSTGQSSGYCLAISYSLWSFK